MCEATRCARLARVLLARLTELITPATAEIARHTTLITSLTTDITGDAKALTRPQTALSCV